MNRSLQIHPKSVRGFTLIELLTVIAIIAILMGLLFPTIQGVRDQANKTKAKNDLMQIVNAVKQYQTEYGKYPIIKAVATDGKYSDAAKQSHLFNILRGTGTETEDLEMNPRKLPFIELPYTKDAKNPKSGIVPAGQTNAGAFLD